MKEISPVVSCKAQKAGRHQAVPELGELVLANEPANRPARMMKIGSLSALSRGSINQPTVNYYKDLCQEGKK